MPAEPSLGDVYFPMSALYQWALAALILATARVSALRSAVALVLAMNGAQVAFRAIEGWGFPASAAPWRGLVEHLIVVTLPFLASRFPVPLGGRLGGRVALVVWLGLVGAPGVRLLLPEVLPAAPGLASALDWGVLVPAREFAVAAATCLFVAHSLPKTLRLPPGPLRTQSLLLAAGLGVGLAYTGTANAHLAMGEVAAHGFPGTGFYGWVKLAFVATAALLGAALSLALVRGLRARRDALGVAAALGVGVVASLLDRGPFGGSLTQEFVVQTFRPILLGVALLQFDVLRAPRALRRPFLAATAFVFLVSTFLLLSAVLALDPLPTTTRLHPAAALVALVAVGALAFAYREPVLEAMRAGDDVTDAAQRRSRLTRYRLALERARESPGRADDGAMERLRRELGLTRREHDALVSVLEGHLVVPTPALVGAGAGHVVGERFEVVGELGRGGQGRALLARDRESGREVVLKEAIRPWEAEGASRREALEREAALVSRVRSPRVARALGVVAERWQTYLVREYAPGESLEGLVARAGPLPPDRAAAIASDVLEGLEALHAAGVLHLDVKPANVVVGPDGRAVLIDHGAARPLPGARDAAGTRRRPGSDDLVSVIWAAPEQLAGRGVDERTDVFQAAGVLYFSLTGTPAVRAGTYAEAHLAVVGGRAPSWPIAVPERLRQAVESARAPEPDRRPASAAQARREVEAVLASLPPGSAADGAP